MEEGDSEDGNEAMRNKEAEGAGEDMQTQGKPYSITPLHNNKSLAKARRQTARINRRQTRPGRSFQP
ncbi:hypothetical protein MY11210_009485 [Beauveria gryllotalpidicola]